MPSSTAAVAATYDATHAAASNSAKCLSRVSLHRTTSSSHGASQDAIVDSADTASTGCAANSAGNAGIARIVAARATAAASARIPKKDGTTSPYKTA